MAEVVSGWQTDNTPIAHYLLLTLRLMLMLMPMAMAMPTPTFMLIDDIIQLLLPSPPIFSLPQLPPYVDHFRHRS